MVSGTRTPQGTRLVPRFTLEVTPGMSIANAIANADALGGDWTILVYPGTYDEADLTPNGGANITIKGMGEGRVVIAPTVTVPVTAVIVSGFTLILEDITVTARDAALPALRVTGGACEACDCELNGVGLGDAIQMIAGTLLLNDSEVPVGDVDLSTAGCTLTATDTNFNGTIDTAGAVAHTITMFNCDLGSQTLNLAATGACSYTFHNCMNMSTITDASLGGTGHLCQCDVLGAGLVKNGTTTWIVDDSGLIAASNTNATGAINIYAGIVLAFTTCTGPILWYEGPALLKVLPTGANDDVDIQAAIDALPATGGEVFLLEGTYYVESSLVLDSYQTLRGSGRNTILTTSTATLDIVTATGGDGSEKVGILITNLCVDGAAGGVAGGDGIGFTYVDYSKITNVWLRRNEGNTIWACIGFDHCDFNEVLANILEDNVCEGIVLYDSTFNIISANISQGGDDRGIGLYSNSDNNTIAENVLREGSTGIYDSGQDNIISGNKCQGYVTHGIHGNGSSNAVISGNICQGNGQHGIRLQSSLFAVVSANKCLRNGRYGIYLDGSSSGIISGNICRENSQDGDNLYGNICLSSADYNLVASNLCRAPTIGTTLTVGEPIAETEIAVTDTAGFEVGMGVVIDLGGVNQEYHRISAITAGAPGVITIDAGLTNAQGAGETIDVPEAQYGINILNVGCDRNMVEGNDLYDSGKTANFNDAGTLTLVRGNRETEIYDNKIYQKMKNTSGGELAAGDVVVFKTGVAAGNEVTTTVTRGDDYIYGMVAETVADNAVGLIQIGGKTTVLKVDGTDDIAIGDFICAFTTAKIGCKGGAGDMAFAIALEAYTTNDSNGEIDALIISAMRL